MGLPRKISALLLVVSSLAASSYTWGRPLEHPHPSSARQATNNTVAVVPMADLLATHCGGQPIMRSLRGADNTSATVPGNCTMVLGAPAGGLTFGAGTTATINGTLTISLGSPPPVSDNDDNDADDNDDDAGEVEWEAGATTTAAALDVNVVEIDIGDGVMLMTTAGPVALNASDDVDVEAGANVTGASGLAVTAGEDVDVESGATLTAAAGNATVSAGSDLDVEDGAGVAAPAGSVALSAADTADVGGAVLTAGTEVTVRAPECDAEGVQVTAPTSSVCEG